MPDFPIRGDGKHRWPDGSYRDTRPPDAPRAENVVALSVETVLPVAAMKVLTGALAAELDCCIIVGANAKGFYHASTTADIPEMIFRIEMFKRELLNRAAAMG